VRGGEGNPGASGPSNDDGTHAPMEDGVKDTTIDDARLAALLDGRLDAAEREDLLARLSESDDDYLVFTDAAAILRKHEPAWANVPVLQPVGADDDPPFAVEAPDISPVPEPAAEREAEADVAVDAGRDVIPLRPKRRFPLAAWGAIAAVLVGVALIPLLRKRGDPYDPARLAAGVAVPRDSFWTAASFFVTRGGSDNPPPIEDRAASARLGALLVDLELAARAGDSAATYEAAQSARNVIGRTGNGSDYLDQPFHDVFDHAGEAPAKMVPRVEEARKATRKAFEGDYFAAGAWSEAARLAARARDAEFFRTPASRDAMEKILALPDLSETSREYAEAVRTTLSAGGTLDWTALQSHLEDLVRQLGI
jgi:hypothetical protein